MGAVFSKPKVPEPEEPQKQPEADADELGRARAEALRGARQRRGYMSTVYSGVMGAGGSGSQQPSRPKLIA